MDDHQYDASFDEQLDRQLWAQESGQAVAGLQTPYERGIYDADVSS